MSAPLWTAREAASAAGGRLIGGDWTALGVSIDTRTLAPGDLFVALSDVRDGHDFVGAAFKAGACAALVSREIADAPGPQLLVPDVLFALERLGAAARARAKAATRVAITGSVGKTTVKEFTARGLGLSGATHRSVKSYNNHWGVPLTLARMPADARFGVFEIGMNHGGEIARLSPQVLPHVAAVTIVEPVHIENFRDESGIADSKSEMWIGLAAGATALVNADNRWAWRVEARAAMRPDVKIARFGSGAGCDGRLLSQTPDGSGQTVEAEILGRRLRYQVAEPGLHWGLNSMCAITLCALAGGDAAAAASVFEHMEALEGRGAVTRLATAKGEITLIDEHYNANPVSMAGAIATLGARPAAGRRIAALGDMLELGEQEAAYHAALAEDLEKARIDLVFCAGPRMRALWDRLPESRQGGYAVEAADLASKVADALASGDMVMVKGSNGARMIRVVEAVKALGQGGGHAR
jgi:UDP-N-acetylmuramoyl-tripeptide--D-alanyl-D-alanine ligase